MRNIAVFFLGLFLSLSTVHSESLSKADEAAIQDSISNQLNAFAAHNDAKAYSYAAPNVTTIFPSVDVFMGMVLRGYQPIYNHSEFKFGTLIMDANKRPAQRVLITDGTGKHYEALYFMEKQADGSWKIAGVQMIEVRGVGV